MLNQIESFLMNKLGGKIVARVSVMAAGALATWLGSEQAQSAIALAIAKAGPVLAAAGVKIEAGPINPIALTAIVGSIAHIAFEFFKAKRAANPSSPTVQTDASKPGAP